ncbi:MAG: ADP-ribosylation factor-like protein [Candidatus Hodarchaeales archaeon]|jgi:GTPase SAR1 family protein
MEQTDKPNKVLFMGLGASGKSSIRSVVFEGKSLEDVKDYNATINYTRSTKNIVDAPFQIFDCGGQESFISVFVGEQAEFIFSDVAVLIWVIDVSNFDSVSTSRFYFDLAQKKLVEYSEGAIVFCLLHKMDLLIPDMKEKFTKTMKSYFTPMTGVEIYYRTTSIYDQSIYKVVGEIIRALIVRNTKAQTVSGAIDEFIKTHDELSGIAVYTDDGLPVFEEGNTDRIILPANLLLASYDRLFEEYQHEEIKTILETKDYIFVFRNIKSELFLSGIAQKIAPLQYVLVKMEQLAEILNQLL